MKNVSLSRELVLEILSVLGREDRFEELADRLRVEANSFLQITPIVIPVCNFCEQPADWNIFTPVSTPMPVCDMHKIMFERGEVS